MKRFFIIVLGTFFTLALFAQGNMLTTKSKKAIEFYKQATYSNSYEQREVLLKDAIKKDKYFVEAYWLLASDYSDRMMPQKAIDLLTLIDSEKFLRREESRMELAEVNFMAGRYKEALNNLDSCQDPNFIRRREALAKRYQAAYDLYTDSIDFHPKKLENVNTQYDNYFPSITADGLMISTTVLVEEETGKYSQEDIYQSIKVGTEWSKAKPLSAPMNTHGNEGSQSFSADGRFMFFVSCDNRNNIGGCDMYYAIRRGQNWSAPINMGDPVNTAYWESNPVLSASGDELYFASNRPNGVGGSDIWRCKVKILDSGMLQFGKPENLGTKINTPDNEFAPFIHPDNNTLYYSSDGLYGLGRRDIYMAKRNGNAFVNPVNIGYPVNTNGDESGFVVDASGEHAYFASDKLDSTTDRMQIYVIDLPQALRPEPMTYFTGIVVDAKTKKVLDARVEIYQLIDNKTQYTSLSDAMNGSFTAYLPTKGSYGISVTRPNYLFYSNSIDSLNKVMKVELQPFSQGNRTTIENLFFNFNSDTIMPESFAAIEHLYMFMTQNPNIKVTLEGHTDNVGNAAYNMDLSQRRAEAVRNALIKKGISSKRIVAIGRGNTQPIESNKTDEGRAKNRRVELIYGQEVTRE